METNKLGIEISVGRWTMPDKIFDTPRQCKLLSDIFSGKRIKTTSIEV